MSTSDSGILRFDVFGREVTVEPGEAVLPAVVLVGCGVYYAGTRGLPDQSMVYAGPLLYATAGLALVTFVQHAFGVADADPGDRTTVSAADAAARPADEESTDADTESPYFTRYTATGLVALSLGYVLALGPVGFVLPTVGFLAAAVALFGERRPVHIAGYSLVLTLATWAVFVYWLNIPL